MLRSAAVAAVLAASAEAFSTPALSGLRMQTGDAQISRKDVLKVAGAGVLAVPALANAATIDPKTGFPREGCSLRLIGVPQMWRRRCRLVEELKWRLTQRPIQNAGEVQGLQGHRFPP